MTLGPALKIGGAVLLAVAVAVGMGRVMYGCGASSRDSEVRDLAVRLAQSEHTIELKEGLYATKLVEMGDLSSLLDKQRDEVRSLNESLKQTHSELLVTQQVAVKWKSAYEGVLQVKQVDAGPSPSIPGTIRKRVDFQRDFGPIAVSGHTLTDPPEGDISVRQVRPLLLTVNVARDPTGKWVSLVTSSDPTIDVGVNLGGVDLGVIPQPSWYQRLWIDLGVTALGDNAGMLGLSYHGKRFSLGLSCFQSSSERGCGLNGGVRIFE